MWYSDLSDCGCSNMPQMFQAQTHTGTTRPPSCASVLIQCITPVAHSAGGHLHVVIGSTYHGCRRWEGEAFRSERSPQTKCHVLPFALTWAQLLSISDGPHHGEYEDLPPHQWPAAMERVMAVFSRLGYLLGCWFSPACVCPKPQSQNHRESLDSRQHAGLLSSLFHFLPPQILFPPLHNSYKKMASEAPDPHAWTRLFLHVWGCGHEKVPGELSKRAFFCCCF